MADFDKAIYKVLENEGGYSNDPHDPGGETCCGISRRYWPKWPGWKYLDNYKPLKNNQTIRHTAVLDAVLEFYRAQFWKPLRCDDIIPQAVAESLFDFAVNVGRKRAVKILQHTINVYVGITTLKEDGIMGAKTIAGITNAYGKSMLFVNGFVQARVDSYLDLCHTNFKKYRYLKGWILRSLKYLEK